MTAVIASAGVELEPTVSSGFGRKVESGIGGEVESGIGGEVRGAGKRLGAGFGRMFGVAGGLLAAADVANLLKDAFGEAREAQKVGALTNAVIKSTGGIANVSAKQVDQLSTSLSNKIGVDDEAIAAGQNMLLTFGNVRNEIGKGNQVFTRATVAANDMAAAFGGDAVSNSKMLGKALNDPTKGLSALTRIGVSFTQQQKDQIKALQESGDMLGAQKIILGEVSKQTKGAAEAMATPGDKAAVAYGNLKEQLGTALLPALDAVQSTFVKMAPSIAKGIGNIGPAFSKAKQFLAPFVAQVQGFFAGEGGSAISTFVATLKANLLPVLQTAANTFQTVILPAVTSFVTYIASALLPVFEQIWGIISTRVLPIISSLAVFFYGTLYPAIIKIVSAILTNLKPVFDQLVATFQQKVLPTLDKLLAKFQEWQPTIQRVITVVVKIIGKILEFAAAILGKVLPVVIRFAGWLIATLVPVVVTVIGWIAKFIGKVIAFGAAVVEGAKKVADFATKVGKHISDVVQFFLDLPTKIKGAFGDAKTMLTTIAGQIVDGLKNGLEDAWHKVTDVVDNLIEKIPKKIRELMGIESPSKVTRKLGQFITQGLVAGIGAEAGLDKQLEKITKAIERALANKDITKSAAKQMSATVDAVGKQLDRLAKRYDKAAGKLKAFQDSRAAMASGISSSLQGELDLGNLASQPNAFGFGGGQVTFAAVASAVAGVASRLRTFAGKLRDMLKAGLPKALVQEVAGLGSQQGIPVADALLSGSKGQRTTLAADYSAITTWANGAGGVVAGAFFDTGIAAQQGIIKGLLKDDTLTRAANVLAKKLTKKIRAALGIKSPSRVMAAQVGAPMMDGLASGFMAHANAASRVMSARTASLVSVPRISVDDVHGSAAGRDPQALLDGMTLNVTLGVSPRTKAQLYLDGKLAAERVF